MDCVWGWQRPIFSVALGFFVFLFCQTHLSNLGLSMKIFLHIFPKLSHDFFVYGNCSHYRTRMTEITDVISLISIFKKKDVAFLAVRAFSVECALKTD